jgi:predicted DNA-binding mobile mystery protein A
MKKLHNSHLVLRQLDKKLHNLLLLRDITPASGWIRLIRTTLNMSLRQLGNKLSMTLQSLSDIEKREVEGTITLKTLKEAAEALDMTLVYGFLPKDGSLEKMIERRAHEMAVKIVNRTSTTMKLEDQQNSAERIQQAVEELTEELKREMPKSLWD